MGEHITQVKSNMFSPKLVLCVCVLFFIRLEAAPKPKPKPDPKPAPQGFLGGGFPPYQGYPPNQGYRPKQGYPPYQDYPAPPYHGSGGINQRMRGVDQHGMGGINQDLTDIHQGWGASNHGRGANQNKLGLYWVPVHIKLKGI